MNPDTITNILLVVICLFVCVLTLQQYLTATRTRKSDDRLKALDDEARARLDILDEQMSEVGGAMMAMQAASGMFRDQGIRTINHNYDGSPLSPSFPISPDRFRRSGEMYIGNPHAPVIPREERPNGSLLWSPAVDLTKPIIPQPFADGEPYRDLDAEVEPVSTFERRSEVAGHQGKAD